MNAHHYQSSLNTNIMIEPSAFGMEIRNSASELLTKCIKDIDNPINKPMKQHDSPPEPLPKKFQKHVSFAPAVLVRRTMSYKDYTPEEIAATWFSHEENQAIQVTCLKQVMYLNTGVEVKGKRYCTRGLEGHTRFGVMSKIQNRSASVKVVIDEQFKQWHESRIIVDDDIIANRYHHISSSCQLWACLVGIHDQHAAEACYDIMEIETIRADAQKIGQPQVSPLDGDRCSSENTGKTLMSVATTARAA